MNGIKSVLITVYSLSLELFVIMGIPSIGLQLSSPLKMAVKSPMMHCVEHTLHANLPTKQSGGT
jgi:hypothetical protein